MSDDFSRLLDAALKHLSGRRFPQAASLYRQVLEMDPDQPEALNGLGALELRAGRAEAAGRLFGRALEQNPEDPGLLNNLGLVRDAQGRHAEAEVFYRRALDLRPDFPEALDNLGGARLRRGQAAEALELYRRSLELAPGRASVLHNLGLALARLDPPDMEAAAGCFRQAALLRPGDWRLLNNLGSALKRAGHPAEAAAALEEALLQDPENPVICHNLASVYLETGELDRAEALFRQEMAARPEAAGPVHGLGLTQLRQGRAAEATTTFLAALTRQPEHPESLVNLAWALAQEGQFAPARRSLEEALAVSPEHPAARLALAQHLLAAGQWPVAWAAWQRRPPFRPLPGPPPLALWEGEIPPAGPLVLWPDGRLAANLVFLRLARLLAGRGAQVILPRHPALGGLASLVPGVTPAPREGPWPAGARLAFLGGLAPRLAADPAELPPGPWLAPPAAAAPDGAALPPPDAGLRVGLAWHEAPATPDRVYHDPPPAALAPLGQVAGLAWIALQPGEPPFEGVLQPWQQPPAPAELASCLAGLDLVVASEGWAALLAVALGVPCLALLGTAPAWWWGWQPGANSPWLPGAELFRCPAPGDWAGAVGPLARRLATWRTGETEGPD
ncbi:MAG: tetratricopeptide repeat protein [Deltaproteobacteria bacterium]|nr:tetratricopeptide repeat protein [Deltaproteobacteria bacterium]